MSEYCRVIALMLLYEGHQREQADKQTRQSAENLENFYFIFPQKMKEIGVS